MRVTGQQRGVVCALALPLLFAMAIPAAAQDKNIRSISRYRVKPDRDGDFRAAIKDYVGVIKKANPDRGFTLWLGLTGPREYVLASYYSKFAEMDVMEDPKLKDVQAQLTGIGARISACVDSGDRYVDELLPELSLPRGTELPKMVRMMRTQVKPDKVNAYTDLIKSELLPAMQKSGVKLFLYARVRFGGPSQEFSSIIGLDSWSNLDEQSPVIKALGVDGYRQFVAKVTPLVERTEYNVYRFLPELSYIPAK
ncbi:MAG: hypothetical protein HY821_13295 [Acidobacteria bacterium]|nr:hypothetical protein [Acidobacteriota bacterium]